MAILCASLKIIMCMAWAVYKTGSRFNNLLFTGRLLGSLLRQPLMQGWFWLAKTILQSTAKGGRRQGRAKKRWENNIREFAKSQRAAENREKSKKLVVKLSVVPQ